MNWYNGNIAEAVAQSKSKNAVFVVYVEGKDDNTAKLSKFINEPKVRDKMQSNDFVAIKIESDSEAYMQFASIYQMVPVPSIFFIGKTGTPLEIVTGVVTSVDELERKILKVLELAGKLPSVSPTSSMSQAFINNESMVAGTSASAAAAPVVQASAEEKKLDVTETSKKSSDSSEIVCEGDVCYKKPKDTTPTPEDQTKPKSTEDTKQVSDKSKDEEDKKAETRKLMEQKRRERVEEEKRLEKERELQRRKEGKDMQNLRDWQKDQELKELKDSIKRDKLEEQAARERILAQISADKAERAHKFASENNSQASTSQAAAAAASLQRTSAPPSAADESRLQFRFASGDNKTKNFKSSTTLGEIRDYVKNELLPGTGIKEFTLATTYPKREFTAEHYSKTLIDLELIPSAVILIIGKEATGPSAMIARQGGLFNIFSMVVMSILNPIFSAITTAKNWITGQRGASDKGGNSAQTGPQKRANEERGGVQDDVAKRRNLDRFLGGGNTTSDTNNSGSGNPSGGSSGSTQAYRRYVSGSNVHRLADNRRDSDDENATWNGNSTQQQ